MTEAIDAIWDIIDELMLLCIDNLWYTLNGIRYPIHTSDIRRTYKSIYGELISKPAVIYTTPHTLYFIVDDDLVIVAGGAMIIVTREHIYNYTQTGRRTLQRGDNIPANIANKIQKINAHFRVHMRGYQSDVIVIDCGGILT